MYKGLLKKSKTELARLVVLLLALVVALGLLTVSRAFTIEKAVSETEGFYLGDVQPTPSGTYTAPCKGGRCYPDTGSGVLPTPTPAGRRCIRFGSWLVCGPRF
jgi:hypothetical protein